MKKSLNSLVCTLVCACLLVAASNFSVAFAQRQRTRPNRSPQQPATQREVLTNAAVIELVKMGLDEQTIIEKIRQSTRGFDTSVAGLRALKAAGISDAIIREMMGVRAAPTTTNNAASPAVNTTNAGQPPPVANAANVAPTVAANASGLAANSALLNDRESGVYLLEGNALREILPTISTQSKASGFLANAMTYGIKKVKTRAKVRGGQANVVTTQRRPEFYFLFDRTYGNAGATMAGFPIADATSPNEFVMVVLERKGNMRQVVVGEFGGIDSTATTGTRNQDIRDFSFERVRPGVFRVTPRADLEPGEYCFYYAGGVGAATNKIFDFSIAPAAK